MAHHACALRAAFFLFRVAAVTHFRRSPGHISECRNLYFFDLRPDTSVHRAEAGRALSVDFVHRAHLWPCVEVPAIALRDDGHSWNPFSDVTSPDSIGSGCIEFAHFGRFVLDHGT